MKSNSIAYLELSFIVHATEDEVKVLEAVRNILPQDLFDQLVFKRRKLKGEHGNPILYFKIRIKDKKVTEAIIKNFSFNFSLLNKEKLQQDFNLYYNKGSLYIRIDKQKAFMGRLRLGKIDPIHIRVRFKTSKIEEVKEICLNMEVFP
jgi:RNA binding exosome subunit